MNGVLVVVVVVDTVVVDNLVDDDDVDGTMSRMVTIPPRTTMMTMWSEVEAVDVASWVM